MKDFEGFVGFLGDLLNYLGGSAEEKEVEVPKYSTENPFLHHMSQSFELPSIAAVVRFAATSKAPILIIKENGHHFSMVDQKVSEPIDLFNRIKK